MEINIIRTLLFVFLMQLQLFSNSIEFTEKEIQWMQNNSPVKYVGDPDWLPFEAFDNKDRYIGLVADLLNHIEQNSPLKFEVIKTSSWDESIKVMNSKKAIIMSQSQDFNKQTENLFSKTYYLNPIVIVMDRKNRYVSSLNEIKNKKIAISSMSSAYAKIQEAYPDIKFLHVVSTKEGVEGVAYGKYDAFVNTLAQTSHAISFLQLESVRVVGKTEFNTKLGFGISKEHPELKSIIDKVLSDIPANLKNEILSKWIYQEYIEKSNYKALYIAISIFIFILGIASLFYARIQKETQEKLAVQHKMLEQQSKMAAMGEMLDATAHQWKQPLNALSMYLDMMKDDYDDGLVDKKYIEELEEGTQAQITHMTTTLQEFRNFFRPNTAVVEFSLLGVIDSVLLLTKDEFLKNNINIILHVDNVIALHGNENEFKHLILNIINNAKDAFNERDIETRTINITALQELEKVYLGIEDNAGGIPSHAIDKVFEANFTTKEDGKGTGIGLYMSSQIIQKMHGEIRVKNINNGAIFEIEIDKNNVKITQ